MSVHEALNDSILIDEMKVMRNSNLSRWNYFLATSHKMNLLITFISLIKTEWFKAFCTCMILKNLILRRNFKFLKFWGLLELPSFPKTHLLGFNVLLVHWRIMKFFGLQDETKFTSLLVKTCPKSLITYSRINCPLRATWILLAIERTLESYIFHLFLAIWYKEILNGTFWHHIIKKYFAT